MQRKSITLELQAGGYAVSRLDAAAPTPAWADGDGFSSISRSRHELSVVCLAQRVPPSVQADRGWTCLRFVGPFAFDETGIVLAVIAPLSEAAIGIFVVSTFDGDYLLLKQGDMTRAAAILAQAGHVLV